jgi:hypothetical protein
VRVRQRLAALEGMPVEQVDVGERRLQQQVGQTPAGSRGRVAVDHAGAPQDLQDRRPLLVAAEPAEQLPQRRQVDVLDVRGEGRVAADVDADDDAGVRGAHDVDWHVVDRAAVDVHLAAVEHRRQHARDRDRCPEPAPQLAVAVDAAVAGGQVR